MDANQVLSSLVASGPVAVVLFFWVWQERKERLATQHKLLEVLEKQTPLLETIRDYLRDIRGGKRGSDPPPQRQQETRR